MKNYILLILLISLASCKQYNLTAPEQQLYNTYNLGDTLYFKSLKTGSTKTFVITDKNQDLEPTSLGHSSSRSSIVYYKDLSPIKAEPNVSNPQLMEIDNGSGTNSIHIKFEDFQNAYSNDFGTLNNTDTLHSNGKTIINYYTLTTSNAIDSLSAVSIIWQQKYGIVKYDIKNGDSYTRTNMPAVVN